MNAGLVQSMRQSGAVPGYNNVTRQSHDRWFDTFNAAVIIRNLLLRGRGPLRAIV